MAGTRNRAFGAALEAAGWRPETLARELNQRLDALGLADRHVHPKTPYKWIRDGKCPHAPLPDLITALLGERLGQRLTVSDLWGNHVPSASLYVPADTGLQTAWNQAGTKEALSQLLGHSPFDQQRRYLPVAGSALTDVARQWLENDPAQLVAVLQGDRVTPSLMDRIERHIIELHYLDDEEGGGGTALEWVDYQFRFLTNLLNRASYEKQIGQRLYVTLGELAQVAGWMAYDAGQHALAQRYYLAGLRATHIAQDSSLGAMILSCMAFQSTYGGRPQDAISLLETARNGSRNSATPTVTAMLWTWQARAHAELGEHKAFAQAINTADDIFENADHAEDPVWIYWMPQPSLTSEVGQAWLQLHQPERAKDVLRVGIDEAYPCDKVLYLAFLARAHLQEDDLDQASDAAEQAIDLARDINSPRGAGFLREIRTYMPAHDPSLRQLDEKLAALERLAPR